METLRSRKRGDIDWKGGKTSAYVFKADDDVSMVGRDAFFEFFFENALGGARAFPSVKQCETEVVDMALGLLNAPPDARGFMTTGGTESIIQAVQTCRDHVRRQRGGTRGRPMNIVAPLTVHPAFDKAARLMDLEVRRVPVGADLRADVVAMSRLIDDDTIMLVGSAPCFPFGVLDPIADLGELAAARGLWLHVDACVGGYLAPFARMIGRAIPAFDFAVPGVSSMSADLHKFGFCPKPASTVFYRSEELASLHAFEFDAWPSGRFVTSTICGTRPAGGVAAAWAVFQYLGVEGYMDIARRLLGFVDAFRAGLAQIPGMRVLGNPDLSIVAYTHDEVDIFRVAELMSARGYLPGLVQQPRALQRMMSLLHEPGAPEYLATLRAAIDEARAAPAAATIKATY